jgi:hypothetical protein
MPLHDRLDPLEFFHEREELRRGETIGGLFSPQ